MRSLIQLYVDMEHTGRNTAFYEKFSTRHAIGTILSAHSHTLQHPVQLLLLGMHITLLRHAASYL